MNKLFKPTVETVLYLPAIVPFAVGVAAILPITGLVEWMDKGQPNRLLVWSAWAVLYWPLTLLGAIGLALMAPFVFLMEWAGTPDYRPGKTIDAGLELLVDAVRYRPV